MTEVAAAAAAAAVTVSQQPFEACDPDAGVRVAALYEAHGRTVLGLCRFLLRDVTEAEDAAQESFLSAYRSLLGGAVPREPAAWLAAIARNECWSRIKLRMREPLALHEVPSPQADPLELAERNADFAVLRAGLEALSRPQREAFMLREFAGLSYSELALALGVSEPAVDSLLFRARTSLRRALSGVNGLLVPVALRDQLARLIPGFDQPAMGTLAKLASLPIAAKLAAAGAGAALVVASSAGLSRHAPSPVASAAPVPAPTRVAHAQAALVPQRPAQYVRKDVAVKAQRVSVPQADVLPVRMLVTAAAPTRMGDRSLKAPQPASTTNDPAPSDPANSPAAAPTDHGGLPPVAPPPSGAPTDGAVPPPAAPSTPVSPSVALSAPSSETSDQPEPPEAPETTTLDD